MRTVVWSVLLATAVWTGTRSAQAEGGNTCCCFCGKKVCVLEVSKAKEDVTCFDVEAKEICIPGIRFPWDKCGTRRCGSVRKICVLKEEKGEKTVCKYDWSIKTICTTCCRRHGLKHGGRHAEVHRDQRVPFEYYAADLEQQLGGSPRESSGQLRQGPPGYATATAMPISTAPVPITPISAAPISTAPGADDSSSRNPVALPAAGVAQAPAIRLRL